MLEPTPKTPGEIAELTRQLLTGQLPPSSYPEFGLIDQRFFDPNQRWLVYATRSEHLNTGRLLGLRPIILTRFESSTEILTAGLAPTSKRNPHSELVVVQPTPAEVGVGSSINSLDQAQRSWYQALIALGLSSEFQTGRISYFDNLGTYRLWTQMSLEELIRFRNDYLGQLLEYRQEPRQTKGPQAEDLIEVIKRFLPTRNGVSTAQDLQIHRNSLIYRCGLIHKLTGIKMDGLNADFDQLNDLESAVKIHTLIPVMEWALQHAGM
jgi:hypothetical protein